jgi:hypothetical protein
MTLAGSIDVEMMNVANKMSCSVINKMQNEHKQRNVMQLDGYFDIDRCKFHSDFNNLTQNGGYLDSLFVDHKHCIFQRPRVEGEKGQNKIMPWEEAFFYPSCVKEDLNVNSKNRVNAQNTKSQYCVPNEIQKMDRYGVITPGEFFRTPCRDTMSHDISKRYNNNI